MTGKERREQLLDIGRRLFAERGLDGTSIEEIAARAGVSKPVVYEHFGGKEGLYAVVVDREVGRFLEMATRVLEGDDTMPKFEAAAVSLLRYIQDNADGFRILVRDSNPTSGSGTFASLISDVASQVEYILGDVLKARGYDPKLAPMYAQMLVGMVRLHRPVVAGRPQARPRGGGRAPGQPGLERPVPARPQAAHLAPGPRPPARLVGPVADPASRAPARPRTPAGTAGSCRRRPRG